MLALTSALGLAVVLSEQFAAPLGLLAEGTRAVAQGDFTRRQPVTSRDELGVLTESFNTMTSQLADAQQKTEESRRATETTRAYLESILGNLSAGVLAFDDRHRLRTANASAAVILQQPLAELTGSALSEWGGRLPALAPFAALVAEGFRGSRDSHWQKQAELSVANLTRVLLMRGSRLPVTPVAGYVVVFDDVTDLVQAQRDAAWGEVARRLAHEIKNPLTPIQLSAERLAVKLAPKLDAADQETLKRGAQTIIATGRGDEAHGRRLRDLRTAAAPGDDAAGRLGRALAGRARVVRQSAPARLSCRCLPRPPSSRANPPACAKCCTIFSRTRSTRRPTSSDPRYDIALEAHGDEVTLSFADAGAGFSDEVLRRAFEPYVTTKAKGTGLGLAIVRKIVDEHHGRVDARQPGAAWRARDDRFPARRAGQRRIDPRWFPPPIS